MATSVKSKVVTTNTVTSKNQKPIAKTCSTNKTSKKRIGKKKLKTSRPIEPRKVKFQKIEESVANFDYAILEDVQVQTEAVSSHYLCIAGKTHSGDKLPDINVRFSEFSNGNWVTQWGSKAIVFDKKKFNDEIRFKALAAKHIKHSVRCSSTGFISNSDRKKGYVDCGGMITAEDYRDDVKSTLQGKLRHFRLPTPTDQPEEVKKCIQSVMRLKELVPRNSDIALLLLVGSVRAVISHFIPITESYFIVGETGGRKSALAAVMQSYFGKGFSDQTQLPAEWEDTECALNEMTHIVKNAILVIDEYTPTELNEKELSKKAESVLRSVANNATRNRAKQDGSLQAPSFPGALVVATGESVPQMVSASLLNRIVFFGLEPDDIDLDKLTEVQQLAAEGELAMFTATFIRYVVKNEQLIKERLTSSHPKHREYFRSKLPKGIHPRMHEYMASLAVSLSLFCYFAKEYGVLSDEAAKSLKRDARQSIIDLANRQCQITSESRMPHLIFKYLIRGLKTGAIHLKSYSNGGMPKDVSKLLGWKNGEPQGEFVGWYNECNNDVYIHASIAAFEVLLKLIPDGYKHRVPLDHKKFWKAIKVAGGLAATDNERLTVRKTDPENKDKVWVYSLSLKLV